MLCWNEMGQKREVISTKTATGRLFCPKQIYRTIDSISPASRIFKQHFPSICIILLSIGEIFVVLMFVVVVVISFHIVNRVSGCFCANMKVPLPGPACSTEKGCKEKLLHL